MRDTFPKARVIPTLNNTSLKTSSPYIIIKNGIIKKIALFTYLKINKNPV